jgi:TolA-binding protein/outer membrane protein OmpA-like peptidoglycan-associated protein
LRHSPPILALVAPLLLVAGCAYFNTFYNAKKYYAEGVKMKDAGQQTQAKAKLDKAIQKSALVLSRWPRSRWADDALFLVGLSYYQQGHYPNAVRHFDQLTLAFPGSGLAPEAELYRGLALLGAKDYGSARVVLDGVKSRRPRFADAAAFHLARSFIDREEPERAVESLAAFVGRYPRSKLRREATRLLAEQTYSLKRFDAAERWYSELARSTDAPRDRAGVNLKVAACRFETGRFDEAAAMAREVLGRYRELDDEANLLLGKALAGAGRYDGALGAWAQVRGSNDIGAEAAFRTGKRYEEQGSFDTARAYFDTAKSRRADSDYGVQAVKRLALLDAYGRQQQGEREPAEGLFLLAEVHNLNLGDYDGAMRLYQQVYDSYPTTDWAAKGLFAKAWILRTMRGDTAAAEPLLRQVIAGYPETEYADESRRWLGLPVPKRAKKETPPPAPTAGKPAAEPGPPASPPEQLVRGKPDSMRDEEEAEEPPPISAPGETGGTGQPGDGRGMPPLGQRAPTPPRSGPVVPDSTAAVRPEPAPTASTRADTVAIVVYFGFDSSDVRGAFADSIAAFAGFLTSHPEVNVQLHGHCDPLGSDEYNQRLGLDRAEAVKRALVRAGVAAERITVRSHGRQELRSTDPDEYWLNRRVESRAH